MKLVGEAFNDDHFYNGSDDQIVVLGIKNISLNIIYHLKCLKLKKFFLGISSWTAIINNQSLLNMNVIKKKVHN